jgi:hypothetical protein
MKRSDNIAFKIINNGTQISQIALKIIPKRFMHYRSAPQKIKNYKYNNIANVCMSPKYVSLARSSQNNEDNSKEIDLECHSEENFQLDDILCNKKYDSTKKEFGYPVDSISLGVSIMQGICMCVPVNTPKINFVKKVIMRQLKATCQWKRRLFIIQYGDILDSTIEIMYHSSTKRWCLDVHLQNFNMAKIVDLKSLRLLPRGSQIKLNLHYFQEDPIFFKEVASQVISLKRMNILLDIDAILPGSILNSFAGATNIISINGINTCCPLYTNQCLKSVRSICIKDFITEITVPTKLKNVLNGFPNLVSLTLQIYEKVYHNNQGEITDLIIALSYLPHTIKSLIIEFTSFNELRADQILSIYKSNQYLEKISIQVRHEERTDYTEFLDSYENQYDNMSNEIKGNISLRKLSIDYPLLINSKEIDLMGSMLQSMHSLEELELGIFFVETPTFHFLSGLGCKSLKLIVYNGMSNEIHILAIYTAVMKAMHGLKYLSISTRQQNENTRKYPIIMNKFSTYNINQVDHPRKIRNICTCNETQCESFSAESPDILGRAPLLEIVINFACHPEPCTLELISHILELQSLQEIVFKNVSEYHLLCIMSLLKRSKKGVNLVRLRCFMQDSLSKNINTRLKEFCASHKSIYNISTQNPHSILIVIL